MILLSNKGRLKEVRFWQGIPETSIFMIRIFLRARDGADSYDHTFGDSFS